MFKFKGNTKILFGKKIYPKSPFLDIYPFLYDDNDTQWSIFKDRG